MARHTSKGYEAMLARRPLSLSDSPGTLPALAGAVFFHNANCIHTLPMGEGERIVPA
jgi:hypothetical protein